MYKQKTNKTCYYTLLLYTYHYMLLDVTYSHVVTIIISFINVIGLLFYFGSTENIFEKTLKMQNIGRKRLSLGISIPAAFLSGIPAAILGAIRK